MQEHFSLLCSPGPEDLLHLHPVPLFPQALAERERRAAPERIEALAERVAAQRARERDLQERYKALSRERQDLAGALAARG